MPAPAACRACREEIELGFDFTMAFQPIVDIGRDRVWGYEALVRGTQGEGAGAILAQVTDETRYRFDQACRVKAIELAGRLFEVDADTKLSINFLPNAVYEPAACIRASLQAARRAGFRHDRIQFEFTENERFADIGHVARIVAEYRRQGFLTALDDFGAGYAGLGLLANFKPDLIKIDMELIRGIDVDRSRRIIVSGVLGIVRELGIDVIAEGVETDAEIATLHGMGVTLFQGYRLARPQIEALPALAERPRLAA